MFASFSDPGAQEKPYYSDYSPLRRSIHTVCTSYYMDLFITIIIFTNLLTMSMEYYNQPKVTMATPPVTCPGTTVTMTQRYRTATGRFCLCVLQYLEEILKYCNYVFTLVFVIEAILKLIAFGLRRFFKERYSHSHIPTVVELYNIEWSHSHINL